jgi:hypothetical protein
MTLFVAVDDDLICERLRHAKRQVVYAAPGITKVVAGVLGALFASADKINVTVVLDGSEEACRLGYGDPDGLKEVSRLAAAQHFALQRQPGLRAAILVTDDAVLVWSPAPRSVEDPAGMGGSPNGVILDGVAEKVADAVGAPGSATTPENAEIGRESLTKAEVERTLEATTKNPITPFDLARQTRVFASKFQFVETELRGAEWIEREMKLSSLLLNVDLPEDVRGLLDTRVMPFVKLAELRVPAPVMIDGQLAYNREGNPLLKPASQSEIRQSWEKLRGRYLIHLRSFGWLIRMSDKPEFEQAVTDFEGGLRGWVTAFSGAVSERRDTLVEQLSAAIMQRMTLARQRENLLDASVVKRTVAESLTKMTGRTEVTVKRFYKAVAPESSRHQEFLRALETSLPKAEFESWYETLTAALER